MHNMQRMQAAGKLLMQVILFVLLFLTGKTSYSRTIGSILCHYAGYHCLHVKRNQSWYTLFPDEHDRSIVMRINRMNTQIWAGMIIAVPDHLKSADIMDFAPFPHQVNAVKEKVIIVDPLYQAWGAYDNTGRLLRWGPASSGKEYCPDVDEPCKTHEGSFRVFSLGSSDCYSTKFPLPDGGAPMPFCMYFNNGQALHGEPNGLPGNNASHGCVRMYVNDAEWLRYDFIEGPTSNNGYRGTRVEVKSYE